MEFNEEQSVAIKSDASNLLVLAGAGTGKTRTIIGRTQRLIQDGVDPARIVIVTFTRRSANELRERLMRSSTTSASRLVTGTFHHLCLRIMSARRKWFGFEGLTIMDRDDQLQLMRLVRGDLVNRDPSIPKAPELINYYSYARNTNQSAKDYLRKFTDLEGPAAETTLKIFEGYRERKRAGGYLDYDDILHRFAKVLHEDEQVRKNVCSRYDHVLVDEMQDTNPLQWLILQSFSQYCKLFCVGDDAQSIYAFRGADFKNVHSFAERVPDGQTLKLKQNYRSTQPILDLANWLLDQSKLKYGKRLESVRGEGHQPLLLDFDSDLDEASWIADAIKERRSDGASWSQHMILCRSAYTARPIEAELIQEKIPYRFIGGMSLLQMAHVRDLLSVLRAVINHQDELAWVRYLTLFSRIGDATASRLVVQLSAAPDIESAQQRLEELLPQRPEIFSLPKQLCVLKDSPSKAVEIAHKHLAKILESKFDNWDSRKRDMVLLENLAKNHRTLSGFLETYTLDPVSATEYAPQEQNDEGVVTLITVHSAKGTECEVCFVPAVQPGNYPHSRSLDDEEAVEEERRVLYVALTRAKDELILSRHLSRGYGRQSWNLAANSSYFLNNLPGRFVQQTASFQSSYDYWDDDVIG
ncbi:MAG: ATP-dependent helicase [Planctomycetota bacterium]